ncbi:hypothetical protein V8C37DRAFT_408330 [Trichoderma ceciliae]
MDERFSSPFPFSPNSAASASASPHPTYTTAGTIYNPSSSQRLQPPTRRGRLLKSTSDTTGFPIDHTKLGYLRASLSDLPLSVKLDYAILQLQNQYGPLQQNYDRAVSPVNSPAHKPRMAAQAPQPYLFHRRPYPNEPGHRSPCLPLFDKANSKPAAVDISSSDDEDDTSTNALMNMTVKSLQNLASYPNPNQKSAQKALLRGTRPKTGSSLGGPSGLSTPSIFRSASPVGGFAPSSDEISNALRHTLSAPGALRQSYFEVRARLRSNSRLIASESGPSADYQSMVESRFSTPSINSDNTDPNSLTYMSLATGSGAPKPLTAGPPGQRQYRPSTFESTFKALSTVPAASQGSIAEVEEEPCLDSIFNMINTMPVTSQGSTADDEYLPAIEAAFRTPSAMPASYRSPMAEDEQNSLIPPDSLLYLTAHSDPEDSFDTDRLSRSGVSSKWPFEGDSKWAAELLRSALQSEDDFNSIYSFPQSTAGPSLSDIWPKNSGDECCMLATPMFPQSTGFACPLTEDDIRERNFRLNMQWYAGTGLFGDAYKPPRLTTETAYPPVVKNVYGAVGDGRPTKEKSAGREDGKRPVRNMLSESDDSNIMNGLALLDEVLSRAT